MTIPVCCCLLAYLEMLALPECVSQTPQSAVAIQACTNIQLCIHASEGLQRLRLYGCSCSPVSWDKGMLDLWLYAMTSGIVAGDSRPSAQEFLLSECKVQEAAHTALLTHLLLPWQEGLPVEQIFAMEGSVKPILYVTKGKLSWHKSLNAEHDAHKVQSPWDIYSKTAQEAADTVILPDVAFLINYGDGPVMTDGLPFIGYCYVRNSELSIPWPITLLDSASSNNTNASRAGPGDARLAKAVFRGSPTGWPRGRRRALMIAGMRHPDLIDSGLASLWGCGQCHEVEEFELQMWQKPMMSMQEQFNKYQYIITAEGNCAANRVKDLLSGDSALFMVQSPQEEWFYPLLVPYKHYIPVAFEPTQYPVEAGLNIVGQVQWAQAHPEEVGQIVRNANEFARLHISRTGQLCFVVRMLCMYHELLQGLENLTALIQEADSLHGHDKKKFLHHARAHLGAWLKG